MTLKVKIKKLLIKLFSCNGSPSKCTSNCLSDNNIIIETVVDGIATVGEKIIEDL